MCDNFIEIVNGKIVNAKPKSILKGHIVCCNECGIIKVDRRKNKPTKKYLAYKKKKLKAIQQYIKRLKCSRQICYYCFCGI